jgi:septum formation protein
MRKQTIRSEFFSDGRATGVGKSSGFSAMNSFILASESPRRIALLRSAGFRFQIEPPAIEESRSEFFSPAELTLFNAFQKGAAVANRFPEELVLAADTIVVQELKIFGKPSDLSDARRILGQLVGKTHDVITGIALIHARRNQLISRAIRTRVKFRALLDWEIEEYLEIVHPLDKAGAYSAQDSPDLIIERFTGSFSNIIGLPMEIIVPLLALAGIHPAAE